MLTISFRADKRKICIVLAAVLLVVTSVIAVTKIRGARQAAESAGLQYTLAGASNEDRINFLAQFGWTVEEEPVEAKDVAIPAQFNDVYQNYNNIQKEQGFDLLPYAGKVCRQWVYKVTNYPQNPDVRATLLVYKDRVVGGDLSTVALDGFMTGFKGEQSSADYGIGSTASGASSAQKGAKSSASSAAKEAKPSASSAIPTDAWPTD